MLLCLTGCHNDVVQSAHRTSPLVDTKYMSESQWNKAAAPDRVGNDEKLWWQTVMHVQSRCKRQTALQAERRSGMT